MKKKALFSDSKPWTESAWVWLATVLLAGMTGAATSTLMDQYGRHAVDLAQEWVLRPIPPFQAAAPPISQPPKPLELPAAVAAVELPKPAIVLPATPPPDLAAPITQSNPPSNRKDHMEKAISCLTRDTRALLQRVEDRFGQVKVVSTCRPGAVVAGTDRPSLHRYGRAVDFLAPDGKKREVVAWLVKNHTTGGTMTYAHSAHIHIDQGRRFASIAGAAKNASRSDTPRVQRAAHRRHHRDDDDWWDL